MESCQIFERSKSKKMKKRGGLLTLEVDFLTFDLGHNVHRNLIKFKVKTLDLLTDFFNRASSRFLI